MALEVDYDGKLMRFVELEDGEIDQMINEWEKKPMVIHSFYLYKTREQIEERLPGFYGFINETNPENYAKNAKEYADKAFADEKEPLRVMKLERLMSNMLNVNEQGAIIRHMAMSEAKIGVHPNYGEKVGKVILAEELGAHYICQALKLRTFEKNVIRREKDTPGFNIAEYMSKLDKIPDEQLDEEARAAKLHSRRYGVHGNIEAKFPPKDINEIRDIHDSAEAAADYVRVKYAQKTIKDAGTVESYFTIGKFDSSYMRLEEKLKTDGVTEKEFVNNYVIPLTRKRSIRALNLEETGLERKVKSESRRRAIDGYVTTGVLLGLSFGGLSPYTLLGPASSFPLYMGIRTIRRLPARARKALGESNSPSAKRIVDAGEKVKKAFKRPFVGEMRGEKKVSNVRKKFSTGMANGLMKIGRGAKKISSWGGWKKADRGMNKITGNKWSSFKKSASWGYSRYADMTSDGLVPMGSRVLDLYGYGDNSWIKKKFTKEKVRESFDEIESYLWELGVDKKLLDEFDSVKDNLEVMDSKELGMSRGLMKLYPRYIFDEYHMAFRLESS